MKQTFVVHHPGIPEGNYLFCRAWVTAGTPLRYYVNPATYGNLFRWTETRGRCLIGIIIQGVKKRNQLKLRGWSRKRHSNTRKKNNLPCKKNISEEVEVFFLMQDSILIEQKKITYNGVFSCFIDSIMNHPFNGLYFFTPCVSHNYLYLSKNLI